MSVLKRSGRAVVGISRKLGWFPNVVYLVGVGRFYKEVNVFLEEWPSLKIIGFEPLPEVVGDFPGELIPKALGTSSGKRLLYVKKRHPSGSSLFPFDKSEKSEHSVEVEVSTLDYEVPEPKGCKSLLWIDCEGNELDVLRGGLDLVQSVEMVNVEMTSDPPSRFWCSPEDVHCWLVSQGFFHQWTHTVRVRIGQWDAVYVKPSIFNPRYCCDPQEITRFKNG